MKHETKVWGPTYKFPKALLNQFSSSLSDRVKAFRAAFSSDDWITIEKLSHQLRGTAGSYGFLDISEIAEKIENSCIEHKKLTEKCQRDLKELELVCERLKPTSDTDAGLFKIH